MEPNYKSTVIFKIGIGKIEAFKVADAAQANHQRDEGTRTFVKFNVTRGISLLHSTDFNRYFECDKSRTKRR